MNMVEQVTDYVKNYDEEVGKAIELELGHYQPGSDDGYGNCTGK